MKIPDLNKELVFFYFSIVLSLIIAGIGYSIQFIFYEEYFSQLSTLNSLLFRMIRMILGYVVVPFVFFVLIGSSVKEYGFQIKSIEGFIKSFIFGTMIYLVPSFIFVKYRIFTSQWFYRTWNETIVFLVIIGVMASITDYWTRGFILLKLEKYYGSIIAIVGQNVIWFAIHIYEIVLLLPFIGLYPSILLTLFLGITGDLITLHYRNISGLMFGHVVLNVCIALAGKNILIL